MEGRIEETMIHGRSPALQRELIWSDDLRIKGRVRTRMSSFSARIDSTFMSDSCPCRMTAVAWLVLYAK